jgi:transposase
MLTVGFDAHSKTSSLCVLNRDGKVVKESRVRGGFGDAVAELGRLEEPFRVCFEASIGYGTLHDGMAALPWCRSVTVAHPGQLRLIFRSKRKNDRVDARKLATLLLLDQVPAVHVPGIEARSWRLLVEHRRRTVDQRTRVKNALRSVLRTHAIRPPKSLWSRAGVAWLRALELPTRGAALRRDMLLEDLTHAERQVARVTEELDEIGKKHPGVTLLRTIPGVGPRTAEAFLAYVDDPSRFGRIKAIGAYFGLVPCQDQSAGTNRLGHITREGPATVRKLVTEAAWRGIVKSPSLRAHFERIKGDDPGRDRIALIATAHHLLRVMLSMLKTGQAWEERLAKEEPNAKASEKAPSRKEPTMKGP